MGDAALKVFFSSTTFYYSQKPYTFYDFITHRIFFLKNMLVCDNILNVPTHKLYHRVTWLCALVFILKYDSNVAALSCVTISDKNVQTKCTPRESVTINAPVNQLLFSLWQSQYKCDCCPAWRYSYALALSMKYIALTQILTIEN